MKNEKKNLIGKKLGNQLIKQLYREKEVLSVTIVGSFSKTYNLDKVGDLDIVVICRKINSKLIKKSKEKIKKVIFKYPVIKRNLKINDTFGPVKYDAQKFFTVHLMIYDIQGHKHHVINSPFTCLDWQRSDWFEGKKLEEIFPVENIYLRDFFEARRGSIEYLKDLKSNNISIRKYEIKKKKIFLKKFNYKINIKNRGEFVFHIINNLINNYNKFYTNKNILVSPVNFKKLFYKITNNDKSLWNKFIKLKKQKSSLTTKYSKKSIFLAEKFLHYFNIFLNNERKKYKSVTFLRHAKTLINDGTFLGQNRNPDISIRKISFKREKRYDLIYASPLKRSISTTKLFSGKKMIISKYLNEINYGKAEGMSLKKYKMNFPKKVKLWKNAVDVRFPQGENTRDVKKRMLKFISNEIHKKINKKKISHVLVVTHNVFLRCLVGHFLKINIKNYFKINIAHLQKFEFIIKNNKIYPNFVRKDFRKFFKGLYD